MMIKLRPYQQDLLKRVQDALDADPKARVMMQLPTGGGKTVIAGDFLADRLVGGRKAVWLTHRRELARQTEKMLTDHGVSARVVRWAADTDAPTINHGVVILMAQKVSRRTSKRKVWGRYNADDLMVIDEAHHAKASGWTRAMQQWPGRIVGMTATPWRLSEKEGFDRLFQELICGPKVAELQAEGSLCNAKTLMPPREQWIIGGKTDRAGDYTESGIELANSPNVMTAGAREFWRKHAEGRPTIAYAVSEVHAHNLKNVFNAAGIPADIILGKSKNVDREKAITNFKSGAIKVLVNVAVATEGFDLPDASCIIITRPTKSLALYLQMVGRGLRPKDGGGNCLILDLAANSNSFGLPEKNHEWSLEPRGAQSMGEAPVVWCPHCKTASPAASHLCQGCDQPFGKDCSRCGKWRAWKRWEHEKYCGDTHDLVCDPCHIDAHIRARLPFVRLLDLEKKIEEINDDRFEALLEKEFQKEANGVYTKREELCASIKNIETRLSNDYEPGELDEKITALRRNKHHLPSKLAHYIELYSNHLPSKLERDIELYLNTLVQRKDELTKLENWPTDEEEQLIFDKVKDKFLSKVHGFNRERF